MVLQAVQEAWCQHLFLVRGSGCLHPWWKVMVIWHVQRSHDNKSSLMKMSSAPEPPTFKKEPPKEKDFQSPGLRGVRTTTLFRAVNPELFIKPNKPVMAFGLVTLSLCVAYIGYLHATQENKKDLYEAIDSEGHSYMRRKTSKWD
ncbi:small integral membrane protein 8 isoform X1 [Trachypithecus francoisi]|nr:small integral membrane protein 8 isoform X1 [Trachypithecus francoisi]